MNALIYTLGVVVFVIGVVLSIALHELGHMYPAKKFGIKVTQFFVGFGNTVWSTKRGETEYGFKAIPLGGYVKLVGMLPPAKDADPHEVRTTNTGLFTQLISDARSAEYEHVDDKDLDRLFYRKPWWQKLIVMAGGPMVNIVIAVFLFAIVFMGFGAITPTTTVRAVSDCAISDAEAGRTCQATDPETPASKAGLEAGDRITGFNGEAISDWKELSEVIRANGSREATIDFVRDGRDLSATVATSVLARADTDDPTKTVEVGFLGVQPTEEMQRQGPVYVAQVMGDYVQGAAQAIWHLPERMVDVTKAAFGAERDPEGPISVVGASRVAGESFTVDDPTWSERAQRVLVLLAGLNLFLAMFNFIPLLPLDGGHIAGALWEAVRRGFAKLRGAPDPGHVDVAKMLPVAYAMGALLMLMSVILIYADIVNPVSLS
ncbi:M50 family metallopeptidase [Aeromicrobium fastidiosum]|uniref:PDZ domain-containing protein n=1 Tax=Aeromicrobium fastidiosum TaxID=52699 RepID=A0A641AL18_9ACTN|nr:M50 family metallopeptidase [Aeromicrobium fastidiosum]KAA1376515.1 PDZ domain-containing protein [Aeromicrobium fastidiosum]MBP2391568.1 membrane-associated protease RseP (regulator of RpoE activity) [Aeromicrobium fastidiosum]